MILREFLLRVLSQYSRPNKPVITVEMIEFNEANCTCEVLSCWCVQLYVSPDFLLSDKV